MNRRLQAIEEKINDGCGMIDVGTDHGIIPIRLALRGYTGNIFASDIHAGPLEAAKRNAATAGVSDRIRFLLCDGLSRCPPDAVDTIVIAGMGGDMIVKILDEAEFCMHSRYQLILQPMTRAEVLRYWLVYNEFEILSECIVEENGGIYQLLTARFGGVTALNDAELFCGKRALAEDETRWLHSLAAQEERLQKALEGLQSGSAEGEREKLYCEILKQMRQMRGET